MFGKSSGISVFSNSCGNFELQIYAKEDAHIWEVSIFMFFDHSVAVALAIFSHFSQKLADPMCILVQSSLKRMDMGNGTERRFVYALSIKSTESMSKILIAFCIIQHNHWSYFTYIHELKYWKSCLPILW